MCVLDAKNKNEWKNIEKLENSGILACPQVWKYIVC